MRVFLLAILLTSSAWGENPNSDNFFDRLGLERPVDNRGFYTFAQIERAYLRTMPLYADSSGHLTTEQERIQEAYIYLREHRSYFMAYAIAVLPSYVAATVVAATTGMVGGTLGRFFYDQFFTPIGMLRVLGERFPDFLAMSLIPAVQGTINPLALMFYWTLQKQAQSQDFSYEGADWPNRTYRRVLGAAAGITGCFGLLMGFLW